MMKKGWMVGLVGIALTHSAVATTIIGVGVENGDFENNGTATAFRPDGTTPITTTTAPSGRQLIANSEINSTFYINGWTGTRTAHPGGNGAWGLDGANAAFEPLPNVYMFVNSGAITLEHDPVVVSASVGDTVTVSFDLYAAGSPASADGKITLGGVDYAWTATSTAGAVLNYTTGPMTLTAAATDAVLSIDLSTVSSGNQTLLDNVTVEVSPPPTVIIGGEVGNGNFENITGGTIAHANGTRIYQNVAGNDATVPGWTATLVGAGYESFDTRTDWASVGGTTSANISFNLNAFDTSVLVSDSYSQSFSAGDAVSLSFDLAGDATGNISYDPILIFDKGLGTEFSVSLTGGPAFHNVSSADQFVNLGYNYTVADSYSSITVEFNGHSTYGGMSSRMNFTVGIDNVVLSLVPTTTSSGVDVRAYGAAEGVVVEFTAYDVEADGTIMLALMGDDGEPIWTGSVAAEAGPEFHARFTVPGLMQGQSYDFQVRDEVGKWWRADGVIVQPFAAEMTAATLAGIEIAFDSVPERVYEIQWCPALGKPWTTVDTVTATAPRTLKTVAPPDPEGASGFFRVLLP